MTIGEALYACVLLLLGVTLSFWVAERRGEVKAITILFVASFCFRVLLIHFNSIIDFFDQKDASELPLQLITSNSALTDVVGGGVGAIFSAKFLLQALLSYPGVHIFEASITVLCITNAWIGALSGLVAYAYLRRLCDERTATIGFLLASCYPGALAFSIFALRDLLAYFLIIVNLLSLVWIVQRKDARIFNVIIFIVSFIAATTVRYVFSPIMMVPIGWMILMAVLRWFRRQPRNARMLAYYATIILLPIIMYAAASTVIALAASKVGLAAGEATLSDLADDYATDRYDRSIGANGSELAGSGGSDILPPSIFMKLPLPVRIGLQTIGMIVVPMPWLLIGMARMLAALDSTFIIFCIAWAWRGRKQPPTTALLMGFAAGTLAMGLVVANGGNAFRMRLSTTPYVMIPAAIYLGKKKRAGASSGELPQETAYAT